MLRLVKRFIKFIGTSAVGSIVDTLVLWLLSDLVFTKGYLGEYIVSPIISFQCAVIVNFTLAYFYIWRDRTLERPGGGTQKMFMLSCISGKTRGHAAHREIHRLGCRNMQHPRNVLFRPAEFHH